MSTSNHSFSEPLHSLRVDLPHRKTFLHELSHVIHGSVSRECLVGVMVIDLDRFGIINDTFGPSAGDQLLRAVAERLAECMGEHGILGYLGADEFGAILPYIPHVDHVTALADTILAAFGTPFLVPYGELFTNVSIGITVYPFDDHDAEDLLRNANTAIRQAKLNGGNAYSWYYAEQRKASSRRLRLYNNMRHALVRGEFALCYQPKVDLRSGCVSGAEALLRWRSPDLGDVSPADFIPVAEDSGLIIRIGEWVLRNACAQNRAWQRAGFSPQSIAVNVSTVQLKQTDFVETVARALQDADLPPRYLGLELTESVFLENGEAIAANLHALDEMGVTIAIDDFGTGYASLGYLKRLPIDTLKVDRSFVQDIATDANSAALITGIVGMSHAIGLQVVAEGVETAEQLAFLYGQDCDFIQGYYFSRPLDAEAYGQLLQNRQHLTVAERRLGYLR